MRTLTLVCLALAALAAPGSAGRAPQGEWRAYGADAFSSKYSPLAQLGPGNFEQLRVAWDWPSPDRDLMRQDPNLKPGPNEGTPLMIGGVLYVPTGLNQVAAIEAHSGRTLWVYNPNSNGNVHRGLAYWEKGADRRLYLATRDSYLIALDPRTGRPIPRFGRGGRVDLTEGLRRPVRDRNLVSVTSPPTVCNDVVVVGGSVDDFQETKEMPVGDVRGYDARTGRLLWTFHTVPQAGEVGNETWEQDSWKYTGAANVWTWMSCDPELDLVYLPVSTPNNDWYGGHRPGAGLFGESVVCLEARTGKPRWHFQIVHHGLWDYDLPCAPNLVDVTVRGRRVKAVAQVTKQAFCFVFDRVTGEPLWPIEERPVPPTPMPGDRAWPTQPFPTKPAPFDRQGLTDADVIDFKPHLKQEALGILRTWNRGVLYTPPTTQRTILMPGWVGGASWAGAAADPETGLLYVPSISNPMWLQLEPPKGPNADVRYKIGENGYHIEGPRGLPLVKPPYGRITAIDLNTGDHRWMVPHGDGPRRHPELRDLSLPPLGLHRRGYLIATKTLLIGTQEGSWFSSERPTEPPVLRAFDKATGRLLGQVPLPRGTHATGAPITYLAKGRQHVAIPYGGGNLPPGILALALP